MASFKFIRRDLQVAKSLSLELTGPIYMGKLVWHAIPYFTTGMIAPGFRNYWGGQEVRYGMPDKGKIELMYLASRQRQSHVRCHFEWQDLCETVWTS